MSGTEHASRRDFLKTVAGAGLAATVGGCQSVQRTAESKGMNILFVMTDQHYHGCLGAAGNPRLRTPNLDRLAREGVLFTQASCPTPFCSPTRASILTGLYPHTHGLVRNVQGRESWLRDGMFPFTEGLLYDAGWATAHRGKWHLGHKGDVRCYEDTDYPGPGYGDYVNAHCPPVADAAEGDAQLWDRPVYMIPAVREGHRQYESWERRSKQDLSLIGRTAMPPECLPESHITRGVLDLIEQHRDRNWMITASYSPPHAYWVCPEPYYSMYDPAEIPMPDNLDACPPWYSEQVGRKLGTMMGAEGIREYLRCYWGQVSYIDDCVGQLLAKLDELDLERKTLVLFTSDHGDMQGRHGVIGKSIAAFYDEIVRVPLIARFPGRIEAGTVVDTQIGSVDLMPTLLDYAGHPIPEGLHGRSLRPLIEGRREERFAFCERSAPNGRWMQRMVRGERWKYVYRSAGGDCELFDIENDPHENSNRYTDPACKTVVAELHDVLRQWMKKTGDPGLALLG